MSREENRRVAAGMQANLSGYLITAALGILAVMAAIGVFIVEHRQSLFCYLLLTLIASTFLVISIYHGGQGINNLADSGLTEDWDFEGTAKHFGAQAVCILSGAIIAFISFFCVAPIAAVENTVAAQELSKRQKLLDEGIQQIQSRITVSDHCNRRTVDGLTANGL